MRGFTTYIVSDRRGKKLYKEDVTGFLVPYGINPRYIMMRDNTIVRDYSYSWYSKEIDHYNPSCTFSFRREDIINYTRVMKNARYIETGKHKLLDQSNVTAQFDVVYDSDGNPIAANVELEHHGSYSCGCIRLSTVIYSLRRSVYCSHKSGISCSTEFTDLGFTPEQITTGEIDGQPHLSITIGPLTFNWSESQYWNEVHSINCKSTGASIPSSIYIPTNSECDVFLPEELDIDEGTLTLLSSITGRQRPA